MLDLDQIAEYIALDKVGPAKKLVSLVIDAADQDVVGDEAILKNGEAVGYVSSGGYAHYVKKSMAQGYVPIEMAKDGEVFDVEINGEMRRAKVNLHPLYDANGGRMRN